MSRPHWVPEEGRRRIAYPALLATTALGTLSANMINAPLYRIQNELGMTAPEAVLTVSAFTVAMATMVPLAGWLCDRFGPRRLLVTALGVLVSADVLASLATGTELLIGARILQGGACSAIPPAVQAVLVHLWPDRRGAIMGAWASAIGLGQAIGPPFGGFVTQASGWRYVFILHAAAVLVMMVLLTLSVPAVRRQRPPVHASALFWLVTGGGAAATATVMAGQGAVWLGAVLLGLGAVACWTLFTRLTRRRLRLVDLPGALRPLLDPAILRGRSYALAAAGAGLSMASLAVFIVAVPLFLASDLGLEPGEIGVLVLPLALTMIVAGPLAARLGARVGTSGQLVRGTGLLTAAAVILTAAMLLEKQVPGGQWTVPLVLTGLILAGAGIAFTQSAAATELVSSPAGGSGTAVGIHNMIRFLAMAAGYSLVSLAYAADLPLLIFPALCVAAVGFLSALRITAPPAPGRP
ncbi:MULTISPECIES: MFS transporter [unclassified Arthrobacter]|uniref:MFS transporter n=1 Tax=unclassified Arthrobacter TaxID=235627 RepID=UPI001E44C52E|nr:MULTISPECIES: MFS transporter [unclassified Arthrobacter]MCC9146716.1 MFS transporter [Arthrobacter sp. zg-Y919]MDK1277947.1 MFS transporter [Arthrobacter sp. zg.Y919]WIB03459.1 MFS transporter [Arthrobacter sp. zg-Y919]